MKFYEKLTKLRKEKNLSQEELADMLDISRQSIYKWETGTNMPDKTNLEKLTKIFNVSFSYLLDDENEDKNVTPTEVTPSKRKRTFRNVFISNHPSHKEKIVALDFIPDAEHGYAPNQKQKVDNSDEIFSSNKSKVEKKLRERGYTNLIQIQHNLLCYYFEDQANKSFGLFFDGAEQFVCPFENFIDASIKNSAPQQKNHDVFSGVNLGGFLVGARTNEQGLEYPATYYLSILYFDENGVNKEYKIRFAKYNEYLFVDIKKENDINVMMDSISMGISSNLKNVTTRLKGIKAQAELIIDNEIEVNELDIPTYIKR